MKHKFWVLILFFTVQVFDLYGQSDTTQYLFGFTPYHLFVQAIKTDFEVARYDSGKIRSIKVSPSVYQGKSGAYENYRFDYAGDRISGFGMDFSFKFGEEIMRRDKAIFGELGIGYQHINIKYEGFVWDTQVVDGITYLVSREAVITEKVDRVDLFFLFSRRANIFYSENLKATYFFGPVYRISKITSSGIPREHFGFLQHGSDGVFLRVGITIEAVFFTKIK